MERTLRLIQRAHEGDKEARDILVEENVGLVWSIVRRFQNRGVESEDLFQIGTIGLIKAVDKFDCSYEVCFSTYAVPMIAGEIKRYLRDDGILKVSRSLKELIQKKEKQVEVVHVGEPQFILTYEDPAGKSERMSWLKTAFVCLVTFFGTMFSIMTFNTDVDIPKLFERISSQFTSDPRGLAILEVTYSVGIGIGVVFFFNHFGKWKITEDPTPMEVEMRAYEEQVDQTILEMESRKENNSG